jgi:uncharacterized membrane protein YcaP (DUF421 family)
MLEDILGTDPKDFTVWQVVIRAFVTYFFTVLIIKLGHKRFMGSSTPFDVVLGFILGSVMSRAINGQAAFLPTLAGGAFLIALHWSTGWLALRNKWVSLLFEGKPHLLYKNGAMDERELRKHLLNKEDIEQYMRESANIEQWDEMESATLERSGKIGIVKKKEK